MTLADIIFTPFYFFFFWLIAKLISRRMPEGSIERKVFVPGLVLKLWGGIGIGLIYIFYYKFGDTLNYHLAGVDISNLLLYSPKHFFQFFFSDADQLDMIPKELVKGRNTDWILTVDSALPVIKLSAIFSLFTAQSYMAQSLFFSLLSYTGVWALYKTFSALYPSLKKEFAIACLFIPSVFFWGSGITKDSLSICALGWVFFSAHQAFFMRKNILIHVPLIWFWTNILLIVKPYIFISFFPFMILWLILIKFKQIQNPVRRTMVSGLVIGAIAIGLILGSNMLSQKIQEELIETTLQTAIGKAKWNQTGYGSLSSSSYELDLEQIDIENPTSILRLMPSSIFLSLYRPFIWEAGKIVILLAAIENLIFLLLSIYVFFKRGFLTIFRKILRDPTLQFFLLFTFAFSFIVGFSSGLFGALVRYKIPMLPFFVAALFILLQKPQKD